jgi:rod shape-determining protein MreC
VKRFTRQRVLLILVLTSVLLITFDSHGGGVVGSTRSAFGYVFRPFRGVARVVTRPARNAWHGVTHYGDLEKENLRLRDLLARQAGDAAAAEAFVQEHNDLLTLEQLPIGPDIATVIALVIGSNARNDQLTVEINQGSRRGIRVGMPVVNGAGLVGKVTAVFPDGAIIRLISDAQFALSVRVACPALVPGVTPTTTTTTIPNRRTTTVPPDTAGGETITTDTVGVVDTIFGGGGTTSLPPDSAVPIAGTSNNGIPANCDRETGSIRGRGKSLSPVIGLLNDDARSRSILVGDQVVTVGGTDSLAPPNLPVGRVSKVTQRRGDSPIVEVRPNADLSHLNFVEVLLYVPASEVGH